MTTYDPMASARRDYIIGAGLALIIAIVGFSVARQTALADEQLELAQRALATSPTTHTFPPDVRLSEIRASAHPKHAFLRRRSITELAPTTHPARPLSGATEQSPDDKLIHDAAQEAELHGAFSRYLPAHKRAIAARPFTHGVLVALTPRGREAPLPFLQLLGVTTLGLLLASVAHVQRRPARTIMLGVAIAVVAAPVFAWQQLGPGLAIIGIAVTMAILHQIGASTKLAVGLREHRVAFRFLAPAMLAMLVLVVVPFCIGIAIGFFDHHQGTWTFVGLRNFVEILSGGGHPLTDPLNFWFILGVTVLWTAVNVALAVGFGVALALVLSRPWFRGRRVFRMLLILPWAIPNYITALIWKGMFAGEYGAINSLLRAMGADGVSWFSSWATAFFANVTTNTWLGFPFMMVVALGALEAIPLDLHEAAKVDGATSWQRFLHITLPHLKPALGPAVALGSIWTFNMFSVIYLVSDGAPGGSTNILVTDAYRWAFQRGERYGMAAAYATLIFLILLLWTIVRAKVLRRDHKGALA